MELPSTQHFPVIPTPAGQTRSPAFDRPWRISLPSSILRFVFLSEAGSRVSPDDFHSTILPLFSIRRRAGTFCARKSCSVSAAPQTAPAMTSDDCSKYACPPSSPFANRDGLRFGQIFNVGNAKVGMGRFINSILGHAARIIITTESGCGFFGVLASRDG